MCLTPAKTDPKTSNPFAKARRMQQLKTLLILTAAILFVGKTSLATALESAPNQGTPAASASEFESDTADLKTLPVVWVNVAKGELKVFGKLVDGKRETLFTTKISIGRNGSGKTKSGDQKTPVGIYKTKKFIERKDLPRRYGNGAFTLNYPNHYDKILDRTGDGIWIHGRPSDKEDAPYLDTKGCVVMDNENLNKLREFIQPHGTTVIISDEFDPTDQNPNQNTIIKRIQNWSNAWVSLDHESYMDFYDKSFFNGSRNYADWDNYKGRINAFKSFINIQLSDFEILNYPEKEDLVWVSFRQKYTSSNYNWEGRKITLWKKDNRHRWKIVFEGDE